MFKAIKFWWYCIKFAWGGSLTLANGLAGFVGGTLTVALLLYFPPLRDFATSAAPALMWGTALLTLLLEAASVFLAFILIYVFRLFWAPVHLYWKQRELAEKLELEAAQKQTDADDTKWTIKDLFYHIDHDYLENKSWEKIGDELRDALSEGRLTMWGRLKETDSGPWVGPRAALTPIEKTYWYRAYFTYFFFHQQATDGVHCYADRKTGRPAYTDLQVSRNEALAAFPGEPDDIADSYPNVRLADSPTAIDLLNGRERPKLIGLLSSGKLCAWARVSASPSSDLFPMDGNIWKTHSLMFLPKGDGPGTINQTYLRPRGTQNSSHYDVCFNYAQLKRVWPALQISQSRCDIGR